MSNLPLHATLTGIFGSIILLILLIFVQDKYQKMYLKTHLETANERLIKGIEVTEAQMQLNNNYVADVSGAFIDVNAVINKN